MNYKKCCTSFDNLPVAINSPTIVAASASIQEVETFSDAAPDDLEELQAASDGQLDHWAAKLDKFDGREYDYITSEKNQGGMGICWAYAAVGAVEANILRDGVDPDVDRGTLDLDEMIAAYGRFNRDGENDPLCLTTNDTYRSDTWKSGGDFADNAFMSMTQGFLLVDQVSKESWSDSALKQRLSQSKYFVQGFKRIDHTEEAIKRAILEYGGVTMEYKAPVTQSQQYLYHGEDATGHASLIIGWDDSISKSLFWPNQPTSDGAWIVKNSWGYGGDKGVNGTCCFYLSYMSYMSDNLYVVDMGLQEDYQNIYYYDGSLSEDNSQYYADAYGAIYKAKLSTANEQEQLTAVSFGIRNERSTVNIEVYKLDEANFGNVNDEINKPDSGTLIGHKYNVYFEDDGFYTVDFDEPINLGQGEIFSIVISGKDSKGGYINPYFAQDYSDSLNDLTYRKYMDEWTSFKGYKNSYSGNTGGSCVRLRAITNLVKTQDALDNDLQYARMELESNLVYYEKDTPQTPALMVYYGNRILQENEDYEVKYLENIKPGTATVTIVGINDYYGEKSATFEIAKPKYPPGMISGYIDVYSDAVRLRDVPTPEGWTWNEDLVLASGDSGFGYQMKYMGDDADCYQSIMCSVKIFKNTFARPDQLDIAGSTVTISGKYPYNGSSIQPDVWVACKGHELKLGRDYTVEYQNNVNVGTATIIITGQGAYSGKATKEFEIKRAKWPSRRPKSIINVGKDITNLSQISLNCPGWSWREHLDITSDVFQATAIYSGEGMNNYANTKMLITITRGSETVKKNIASIAELRLEQTEYVYNGQEKKPTVIARDGDDELLSNTDFEVEYRNNIDAGEASVIVKGINKYRGSTTIYFTIKRANRDNFKVILANWIYGQTASEPRVEGQVGAARVTYTYSDMKDGTYTRNQPTFAGTYWIKAVVEQSQNYNSAEAKASFVIEKADRPKNMPNTEMTIGRKAKTLQDVELDAEGWQWEDPDAEIVGENMTAMAVYSDTENYKNYTLRITLTKEPRKDISDLYVDLDVKNFVYNGTEREPNVIAKDGDTALASGVDYDVRYEDNKFAGHGKAIVTFKNDYVGSTEIEFTIEKAAKPSVSDTTIRLDRKVAELSDVQLPDNFVWKNESLEITGNRMTAKAVYTGDDASSFETTELTFEIIITAHSIEAGQQEPPEEPKRDDLIWLAIGVPIAVLIIAGSVAIAVAKRRRKNS